MIGSALKGHLINVSSTRHTPFSNKQHFTGGTGDVSQPFNLFHEAKERNLVETVSWLIPLDLRKLADVVTRAARLGFLFIYCYCYHYWMYTTNFSLDSSKLFHLK